MYVTQVVINANIVTYVDALYFTVTTLTTTGFGDIVLQGEYARLSSIAIMLLGFAPVPPAGTSGVPTRKVSFRCPDCGLSRHEADANALQALRPSAEHREHRRVRGVVGTARIFSLPVYVSAVIVVLE